MSSLKNLSLLNANTPTIAPTRSLNIINIALLVAGAYLIYTLVFKKSKQEPSQELEKQLDVVKAQVEKEKAKDEKNKIDEKFRNFSY